MGQAFDAMDANAVASNAIAIKHAGYDAVGMYYFDRSEIKTLLTHQVAKTVSAAGLFIFSVYENGAPTTRSYFAQGLAGFDAETALRCARAAGQPEGTPIYFAVDYDAPQIPGPGDDLTLITTYFTQVRKALAGAYTAGVYGSGSVCQHLSELGLVSHTWLSLSSGWSGYEDWKPGADILQAEGIDVPGLPAGSVDMDSTNGNAGGWMVTPP